jgi:hypothetical protein
MIYVYTAGTLRVHVHVTVRLFNCACTVGLQYVYVYICTTLYTYDLSALKFERANGRNDRSVDAGDT